MESRVVGYRRPYIALFGAIAWCGLILQLCLIVGAAQTQGRSLAMAIGNYFGFFTILTNILTALMFTSPVLAPETRLGKFFARADVIAAVTLYMVIVSIVYNLLLRHLMDLSTAVLLTADIIVHQLMPVACVVYWLVFVPRGTLRWGQVVGWLAYPVVYFLYVLARGAAFGVYPYPFMDVAKLGYGGVLLQCVGILVAFLGMGLLFVWIDRIGTSKHVS